MEVMLYEIVDCEKLVLMDGSEWMVNPGDTPTVCTWTPTSMIKIQSINTDDQYSYRLTNLSIEVSVYALKLGYTQAPDAFSDY